MEFRAFSDGPLSQTVSTKVCPGMVLCHSERAGQVFQWQVPGSLQSCVDETCSTVRLIKMCWMVVRYYWVLRRDHTEGGSCTRARVGQAQWYTVALLHLGCALGTYMLACRVSHTSGSTPLPSA